jgi:hypothetical protein
MESFPCGEVWAQADPAAKRHTKTVFLILIILSSPGDTTRKALITAGNESQSDLRTAPLCGSLYTEHYGGRL